MARFESFGGYPTLSISMIRLSQCGFYYTRVRDRVKCFSCGCEHEGWQSGNDPFTIHRELAPRCEFLNGRQGGHVGIPVDRPLRHSYQRESLSSRARMTMFRQEEPVGLHSVQQQSKPDDRQRLSPGNLGVVRNEPKYPRYAVPAVRLSSYGGWPGYISQTPQTLSRAGLFYIGFGDNVRCFFCGGGLREWEPTDDPWVEHARWYPTCQYLQMSRGDTFIQEVQRGQNVSEKDPSRLKNEMVQNKSEPESVPTAAVLSVQELGYTQDTIDSAMRFIKNRQGKEDNIGADSILEMIFEMEEQPTLFTEENAASSSLDVSPEHCELSGSNSECVTTESLATPMNGLSLTGSPPNISIDEISTLLEENKKLKLETRCKVCLKNEANITLLPCGHIACCHSCMVLLRSCPVCDRHIEETLKTFRS
ncbi:hypothetical protein ScPMuIL_009135 [Solemya velum]